jgi:TonB family protein
MAPTKLSETITKSVPIAPFEPTHSSRKDQVQACPAIFEYHPEVDGIYKVGEDVKPPKITNEVNAEFSDEARRIISEIHIKDFKAVSLLSLVVDVNGKPKDICVKKPAGFGLDKQAANAAKQYRFQAATKNGVPVAARIIINVNFRTF